MTDIQQNDKPGTQPEKVKVLPPWYTFQRTLSHSIGYAPHIMVSELFDDDPKYLVKVVTFEADTAQALANVVASAQSFGNITVHVEIYDIDGKQYGSTARTPSLQDLKLSLYNNPLVHDVTEKKIACQPKVVQYSNGDISVPDGFRSILAAEAFKEVVVSVVDTYTAAATTTFGQQ